MSGNGKLDDMLTTEGRDQLLRSSRCNDLSMIHDPNTVAQSLRFLHIVGGQDDGSPRLLQAVHEVPQMTPCLGIEPGCGFIEKEKLRIAY